MNPEKILLWPDGAPGAIGTEEADEPSIKMYMPRNAPHNCAAVVVCPGGGYCTLALGHEGEAIAQWLNERGIAAFVLRYRHAPRYGHPWPLQDAKRALRIVRARATEWNIDAARIGIWGFSAGGHLASTLSTHFDAGDAQAEDAVERVNCRPDFSVLIYPVITLEGPHAHTGSRDNLLGKEPMSQLMEEYSNEKRVTPQTPPTFLFHTGADTVVPPENSVLYYLALRKASVPSEMHIYETGEHGGGLWESDKALSTWPLLLDNWLRGRGAIESEG